MKFDSFTQLIEVIKTHRQFDNEIKIKRLKKEMQILSNYENPSTTIQQIELTSIGIELLVNFHLNKIKNKFRQSYYVYKMILDFEYPFNRPIIYFMKKDSAYAQCKDLLEILLQGSNWGPSLMLTHFLDRLQTISEAIRQSNAFESKSMYRIGQNYRKSLLQSMEIKLFQVEEYSWKYLIKSTKKRYLGLTNETLFLFSLQKDNENIALDFWKPINQITTAKASVSSNKKFNLQISYTEEQKETILYFGGQQKIETILGYLNPIEMIERKVSQIEKNVASIQKAKYWNDNTDMIRDFTQLIEHYSLKDPTKSERYIKLMKQLIAKFYEAGIKEESVEQKKNQYQVQKEEIQT